MSNMPTNFTRYRSTDVYIKNETTPFSGSDSGPTAPAAGDFFFVSEVPAMSQAGNYTDFSEVGSELITTRKVLNYMEYTAYDLSFYAKPDNAAGQAPAEDKLLESFFGTKSVSGGASVTYTFSNTIQTHSIWALQKGSSGKDARQTYCAAGSIPTSFSLSLAKDGPVTYSMGFQSPRIFYSGTGEVASSSFSSPTLTTVIDAPIAYNGATINASNSFFPNQLVGFFNGSTGALINDNSGSGFAVATSSSTNGNITMAPGSDISGTVVDGVLIQPFLPAMAASVPLMNDGSTSFSVLDQTDVSFFLGAQDVASGSLIADAYKLNATNLSMEFDRGITTPALTEMSGTAFADAKYVLNELAISGTATILCRPSEIPKVESLRREPRKAVAIRIKNANANIDFYAPAAHFEIPAISEAEGVCQLEMSFTVVKGTNTTDANKFKLIYS